MTKYEFRVVQWPVAEADGRDGREIEDNFNILGGEGFAVVAAVPRGDRSMVIFQKPGH